MAEVLSQSQIDALLNAALNGSMDLEETAEEAPEKKYRKYDFYSPRKFTKDRLRVLGSIFDSYARTLTSRINALLRTNCDIEVESIEEQRYYEFSNALTEGDVLTLSHLSQEELGEDIPILFHMTRPLTLSMIDRLLGCSGDQDDSLPNDYALTDLELKLYEGLMRDFVSLLSSSWENYLILEFLYSRVEVNPTLVQLISLDETVVIVDVKLTFPNGTGRLSICLPGVVLTNIFATISKENGSSRMAVEDKSEEIFDTIRVSELELVAELCSTTIRLQDLYHLGVGDVIDLSCQKDSLAQVKVAGQVWFAGQMGVFHKNMAIKIQEAYEGPEGGMPDVE